MMYKSLISVLLLAIVAKTQAQLSNEPTACNTNARPVVFVHGFLASGDTWATQAQRFISNGYCENRLFAFDWNSIGSKQKNDSLLSVFIQEVLQKTKATQVDLVAHSAGGGLCYTYLKDSLKAATVAHYVHIGSNRMKAPAGPTGKVPTLNIYSTADKAVRNSGDIPGAKNEKLSGYDHLQVATAKASFVAMYQFFTGTNSKLYDIIPAKQPYYRICAGKAVTLGENTRLINNDSFRVFCHNASTGMRTPIKSGQPEDAYVPWRVFGDGGEWRFAVTAKTYLEFQVRPKNSRPIFYFFEPLQQTNPLVYIRVLPTEGMIANMLRGIPNDDTQTALVIFTANQAVISGRDTLAIDSIPLSLPTLTPADKTAIAHFIFDDGDGKTTGKPLKNFAAAPFLSGVDVFIPADEKKTMRIYFNGRSIVVPRRKSSEGIMVVVFN